MSEFPSVLDERRAPVDIRVGSTPLSSREERVRGVHANINPEQVKGLPLTDQERKLLFERLGRLQVEIESAPTYDGAL